MAGKKAASSNTGGFCVFGLFACLTTSASSACQRYFFDTDFTMCEIIAECFVQSRLATLMDNGKVWLDEAKNE